MQQSAANPRAINNKAHAFRCLTTESSSSSAAPTELQLETLEGKGGGMIDDEEERSDDWYEKRNPNR